MTCQAETTPQTCRMELFDYLAQSDSAGTTTQQTQPATEAPTDGGAQGPGGLFGGGSFLWIMIGGMALFMYFFVIRPQRKEEKRKKEMLSSLKKGDRIVTTSGILGTVASVKDETVFVNVGDGTRLEFLRSAISTVSTENNENNKSEKADKKKK